MLRGNLGEASCAPTGTHLWSKSDGSLHKIWRAFGTPTKTHLRTRAAKPPSRIQEPLAKLSSQECHQPKSDVYCLWEPLRCIVNRRKTNSIACLPPPIAGPCKLVVRNRSKPLGFVHQATTTESSTALDSPCAQRQPWSGIVCTNRHALAEHN